MQQQTTNVIVMISPDSFQYNDQTASTNRFQLQPTQQIDFRNAAISEFNQMVTTLKEHKIRVIVLPSREDVATPDAVFPNNWFSVHATAQGKLVLVLYPMLALNRRMERQVDLLLSALKNQGILINDIIDFSHYENQDKILEGTGSLVLDRVNQIAYASLSPRTNPEVLERFSEKMGYRPVLFHSFKNNESVYHTNVVMSVGAHFAVIAAETIPDISERASVLKSLQESGKEIITITIDQMNQMAGNILELSSLEGKSKIVMSRTAFRTFTLDQHAIFNQYGEIIVVDIDMIEKLGGGSARCMMAEVFL